MKLIYSLNMVRFYNILKYETQIFHHRRVTHSFFIESHMSNDKISLHGLAHVICPPVAINDVFYNEGRKVDCFLQLAMGDSWRYYTVFIGVNYVILFILMLSTNTTTNLNNWANIFQTEAYFTEMPYYII